MYELQSKQQPRRQQTGRPSGQPAGQPADNALWRGVISGMIAFVVALILGLSGALIGYAIIAGSLPKAYALENTANQLGSTYIYDRDGNLLSQLFKPDDVNAGRRTLVPLAQIPKTLQQATIDTEDANF